MSVEEVLARVPDTVRRFLATSPNPQADALYLFLGSNATRDDWLRLFLGTSPCREKDLSFLVFKLPELRHEWEEAARHYQAVRHGQTGGRPRKTAEEDQIKAAAAAVRQKRPHLNEAPKACFYAAVLQELGWEGKRITRIRKVLRKAK